MVAPAEAADRADATLADVADIITDGGFTVTDGGFTITEESPAATPVPAEEGDDCNDGERVKQFDNEDEEKTVGGDGEEEEKKCEPDENTISNNDQESMIISAVTPTPAIEIEDKILNTAPREEEHIINKAPSIGSLNKAPSIDDLQTLDEKS